MTHSEPTDKRRLYGRRLGRPLNTERQEAMDHLYPRLEVPRSALTQKADISPASLFDTDKTAYWMEIGFGNGEHVAAMMQQTPDYGYLAAEPYINGMAAFMREIRAWDNQNVRVLMDDAIMLVKSLTDDALDGLYVLNPDPWPKSKHHKRRIINPDNLNDFARVLKSGAKLIMATDVDDLAEWMATQAANHPDFEWTATQADDWRVTPSDWIKTRYEQKGEKAGRKQSYLIFERT